MEEVYFRGSSATYVLGKIPFVCFKTIKPEGELELFLGRCEMRSAWHQCSRGLSSAGRRALRPRLIPGLFLASTTAGAELGSVSS